MEKNIEMSLLFDFYGELLRPVCRRAVDLYYNNDLSLAEIADDMEITRQGVRDNIKRGEKRLSELEKKLGLLNRFRLLESGLGEITALAESIGNISTDAKITELAAKIVRAAGSLGE